MKLNVSQKLALAAASFVAVALSIIAGSSASGGGGPGFGSQNNPGMQGNAFGRTAGGGPGFGPENNPGVEGSANGRSIASDASAGRSDGHEASSHSGSASDKEQAIDTDVDSGRGKAGSEEKRDRQGGECGLQRKGCLGQTEQRQRLQTINVACGPHRLLLHLHRQWYVLLNGRAGKPRPTK